MVRGALGGALVSLFFLAVCVSGSPSAGPTASPSLALSQMPTHSAAEGDPSMVPVVAGVGGVILTFLGAVALYLMYKGEGRRRRATIKGDSDSIPAPTPTVASVQENPMQQGADQASKSKKSGKKGAKMEAEITEVDEEKGFEVNSVSVEIEERRL